MFDLDEMTGTVADQFRAIKARNVRWSLTSVPLVDIMDQFNVDRSDAMVIRELAFEVAAPQRLIEVVGEQRRGRGPDQSQRAGKSGYHARKATVHSAWLANPHITVDEVVKLVDVHPSTARNYLVELRTQHI